jgi:hypothetical protein
MKRYLATMLMLATLLVALPTLASTWSGENGLIRFSFVEGDSLVTVWDSGEASGGVTKLKVYCWLTDLDSVKHDGEAFLHIGGYELALDIQGAEAFILGQDIPGKHLNMGKEKGQIAVGLHPGLKITGGQVLLATWELMFQGRPTDVRFGLDKSGANSAATLEGAPKDELQAIYVGSESSRQLLFMFAAGYEPAWLNPTGEADQTPLSGPQSWKDVGVFDGR